MIEQASNLTDQVRKKAMSCVDSSASKALKKQYKLWSALQSVGQSIHEAVLLRSGTRGQKRVLSPPFAESKEWSHVQRLYAILAITQSSLRDLKETDGDAKKEQRDTLLEQARTCGAVKEWKTITPKFALLLAGKVF